MFPDYILITISFAIFIIFSIVKSIDMGSNDSDIQSRGKAIFFSTFLDMKIVLRTVVHVVITFIAFTIIFLFIHMIITMITDRAELSNAAKDTIMICVNMFLGIFKLKSVLIAVLILIPVFILFFMLIFTDTLYRPRKLNDDDTNNEEGERINGTMYHYIFILVNILFFITLFYLLYQFLINKDGKDSTSNSKPPSTPSNTSSNSKTSRLGSLFSKVKGSFGKEESAPASLGKNVDASEILSGEKKPEKSRFKKFIGNLKASKDALKEKIKFGKSGDGKSNVENIMEKPLETGTPPQETSSESK